MILARRKYFASLWNDASRGAGFRSHSVGSPWRSALKAGTKAVMNQEVVQSLKQSLAQTSALRCGARVLKYSAPSLVTQGCSVILIADMTISANKAF